MAGAPSQRDARQPPPPDSRLPLVHAGGPHGVGKDEIVVLRDVKKSFNDQEVLRGINLTARRKETVVIIGGSGAGKTTLLKILIGLDRPTTEHLWMEDMAALGERDLTDAAEVRHGVSVLGAARSMNVLENVASRCVSTRSSRRRSRSAYGEARDSSGSIRRSSRRRSVLARRRKRKSVGLRAR